MIPSVGGMEVVILLVIVLLLFGAKRIPELAKGLGSGVREFRKGVSGREENDGVRERDFHAELPRTEEPAADQPYVEVEDTPAEQRA